MANIASHKYPIYLPSLGRYDPKLAIGINMLINHGIHDFYLVVAEWEKEQYLELMLKLLPSWPSDHLLTTEQGIGRVRQSILEFARANGYQKFWAIDDDVWNVKRGKDKINISELFLTHEAMMDENDSIGSLSPQYNNALWRVEGDFLINKQCPGLITIHRSDVPFDFDTRLRISEETDWTYKMILYGYDVIIDNRFNFATKPIGNYKGKVGGIAYKENVMNEALEILSEKFGDRSLRIRNAGTDEVGFARNWKAILELRDSGEFDRSLLEQY